MLEFILKLLLGAAAGWVASRLMGKKKNNWLVNIILGIVGSVVGGYIAGFLGLGGGRAVQLLVAAGGACLVIWVARLIAK